MHELFGMKLYFSDALPIGYVILYIPLVLLFLFICYRLILKRIPVAWMRRGTVLLILITLSAAPWWDVYRLSSEATRLCVEQGGLHVYKKEKAEGFIGSSSIQYWSKYGFNYLEGGDERNKFRWTISNGNVLREKIQDFKSQYILKITKNNKPITNYFRKSIYQVNELNSGEELGNLVIFRIHPTIIDTVLLNIFGGSIIFWDCGNVVSAGKGSSVPISAKYIYGPNDLIKATLIPK